MITQQIGNYFIMDSEQLVSKPYHEMQSEALGDIGKKTTNTDKHATVKNNVCENHYSIVKSELEREKDSRLRHIHENTSRLRYEVKLLDLNRRKNEIELRKRIEPRKDFTYDDTQLSKTEKRLGANIESHYLARRLRYPVRAKATADLVVTPVVAKARKTLRETKKRPDSERCVMAKSVSPSMTVDSSHVRDTRFRSKWPPSRSAPHTGSSTTSRSRSHDRRSRLPDIHQHFDSSSHHEKHRGSSQRVKFAFESPHNLIVSSSEGRSVNPSDFMIRSHTYHEGMGRRSNYYDSSSDNDNDDEYGSERIDLRAILFGKSKDDDTMSLKSHPQTHSVATFNSQNYGAIARRSQGAPKQQTQEKLLKEAKVIQGKISAFLHKLETDPPIRRRGHYEEESDEEEMIEDEDNTIPIFLRKNRPAASKPEPPKKVEPPPQKEEPKPAETEEKEESGSEEERDEEEEEEKRTLKDAWKYIRGHVENGTLRGTYTAADLVLQQLTGVLVGHGRRPTVPLHAASRAMRHTATFKMRKVVESLIESRTRYEQHEVDELKKKMDGEVEVAPAVPASETSKEVPSL